MRGFLAYRGPSLLDGAPIVAVVTLDSLNAKTGDMAQAWVLRGDTSVQDAIATGSDSSICGHCPHRSGGRTGRSCYVVTWLGPTNVWKAFAKGRYPLLSPAEGAAQLAGRNIRLAAYGDPAAVPTTVWRNLLRFTRGHTGYTHQWRTCDPRLAALCMASVDSPAEAVEARALGWRTFRVRRVEDALDDQEIACPAARESGHRLTCESCKLCVGTARAGARSVAIVAHGQRAAFFYDRA